jgi:hypothetical protein
METLWRPITDQASNYKNFMKLWLNITEPRKNYLVEYIFCYVRKIFTLTDVIN